MITESIEKEIIRLYFQEMFSYSQLMAYFKNKYTYAELKKVITKHIRKYQEN